MLVYEQGNHNWGQQKTAIFLFSQVLSRKKMQNYIQFKFWTNYCRLLHATRI